VVGDPTEGALLVLGHKAGLVQAPAEAAWPRFDSIPFESKHRFMASAHHDGDGQPWIFVKGAPEQMFDICSTELGPGGERPIGVDTWRRSATDIAARGLRLLGLACRRAAPEGAALAFSDVEHGYTMLALLGIADPPRAEAVRAVADCHAAGIRVKMITGDHAGTAATIARMIGIDDAPKPINEHPSPPSIITGAEMAAIADSDLSARAESIAVFARMTPEQKLRLVRALQARGHVVAMTGDGVNDAPALRQADIGVAMGVAGTEVAKDAADMVLADDNFATIEAAVEEGRNVFSNLTKFIVWTLPTNGGEAFIILAAITLGWPLPIMPVHALYINMVTAILLGMPLIFESREPNVMARPPRDPDRPLLTFELFMRTGLVSLLLCAGSMGLFQWELSRGMSEPAARTAAVSVIVIGEIFYLFSSRALLRPAWAVPLFSNLWLWAGIAAMIAVQLGFAHLSVVNRLFHTAPLDAAAWSRVFLAGASVLLIVEAEKAIRRSTARTQPSDSA